MNDLIMHPHEHAVKHQRFVAATPEQQADLERQIGRNLYRRGKPLSECRSDDMAAGWLAAEFAGYMAYSRHMEAEGVPAAKAFAFVNWNSGIEWGW